MEATRGQDYNKRGQRELGAKIYSDQLIDIVTNLYEFLVHSAGWNGVCRMDSAEKL